MDISAGQSVAVTGTSGSGKSTLLHLIGATDRADRGTITVDGQPITTLGRNALAGYRRTVGFVFQRYHLLPALTLLDNVAAPLLPYRTSFDRTGRAQELLDAVGLGDRGKDMPQHLSGGQQQRVALARALIGDPVLLLSDEPTGNLDSRTGTEVLDLLLRLREQRAFTAIIATHDTAVAARCQQILRLQVGRRTTHQAQQDEPQQVMRE